jgi:hypothetical protein
LHVHAGMSPGFIGAKQLRQQRARSNTRLRI